MFENLVLSQTTPTIAVAVIYCLWNRARMYHLRREGRFRERVAYMLWNVAHEMN